ncbi:hypothetical protein EGW08_005072 [Elysia chlorotica]|uniref:riboflavin kinase n=1 Tax=Elysia chlorotica TaxID=188477 RepID=A0A3S0ZVR0_ELYCH|nr:hypothetical protein EGW08_005072 [Elysia chlorotica]
MATKHRPRSRSSSSDIPYFAEGEVVSGFGRGSKELGIPTANFPESVIRDLPPSFECGVYYGWAKLSSYPQVFKMTMCVGWNPYYQNTVKTMETHIIHKFDSDFYGDIMKIIVLGYMRPMCDFPSLGSLIEAIHRDIEVASKHLDTEESLQFKNDPFFMSFHPDMASDSKGSLNAHQSMASDSGKKLHGNCNNSDDIITTLDANKSGEGVSSDLLSKTENSVPVVENDLRYSRHISTRKINQSSNTSFSKSDFSHPVIEYQNLCSDSNSI